MSRPSALRNLRAGDWKLLAALFVVAVGLVAVFAFAARTTPTYLVNGLSIPVTFEVAGRRVPLQPGWRDEVKLPVGAHHVRVLAADGRVVDEIPIVIPRFVDAIVVNPLGAAPVYVERLFYGLAGSTTPPSVDFRGGRRVTLVKSVDDPFRDPPRQISAKRNERVTRVHLALADGGAPTTLGYLLDHDEAGRAMSIATALLERDPGERSVLMAVEVGGRLAGVAGVHAVSARARVTAPSLGVGHSVYALAMGALGRDAELVAELRAARDAQPDDPLRGAAFARVAPREEARAEYAALVAKHPASAEVAISAAAFALDDDRPADAIELFQRHAGSPAYAHAVELHARAVARVSGPQAAYDLLARALDAQPDEGASLFAASLARLPEVKGDAHHLMSATTPQRRAALLAELGAPDDAAARDDRRLAVVLSLIRRLETSTSGALTAWDSELDHASRALVPSETRLWLALESARLGAPLAVDPLAGMPLMPVPIADVHAYVAGGPEPPRLFRVHPSLRAVIEASRARALASASRPTSEAEAIVARCSPGASLARRLLGVGTPKRAAPRERAQPRPKK